MRRETNEITSDKVIRAMFVFALGVVFTVIQLAAEPTNLVLLVLGILWSLIALVFTVRAVKKDWTEE
jgi:hypothetical protein